MPEYIFNKPSIQKFPAFENALRACPKYDYFIFEYPNVYVTTTDTLSESELQQLQTIVDDYVDPEVFLTLNSSIIDSVRSLTTNSATPEIVSTFIYSNTATTGTGATFNAIKTVLEYATDNVQDLADFSGSCNVTLVIHCYTRDYQVASHSIDITDIVNSWKEEALNNATGPRLAYRTFLIEGLRNAVANYDCLWNYKLSVSDPRVKVTIHAKQMLYYDIQ